MKLPRDWKELIGLLCLNRVRFVVVGAHALAFHGRPRATGDLDLLVEPTLLNARRLGMALEAFGFPALARETSRFARPDLLDLALLTEADRSSTRGARPRGRSKIRKTPG